MRNKEVELIAALAEGSLEDETAARALVASSTKHQAEYEAQKTAYQALSSIPPAQLTEHETAALHRDIWTELQNQPVAGTAKPPWYYRWSYAAAGIFVVVGLFVVLDQAIPDSAPTALIGSEDASEAATSDEGSAGFGDSGTTSADDTATDTTEAAAATDGEAGVDEEGTKQFATPTVNSLTDLALLARSGDLEYDEPSPPDEAEACLIEAGLADYVVLGEVVEETRYLLAVPPDSDLETDTPISFVNADFCTEFYVDE